MMTPATMLARATAAATAAGPVTLNSIFSPPASCTDIYYKTGVLTLGGPEATSISGCFPSGWETGTTQFFTATTPMCPSGYSMITEGVVNIDTLTATTGTCCPNDYSTLVGSAFFDGERCTSKISSAANITVTSNAKQGIGYTTTVLSVRSGDGLNAYGLAMQWQPATSTSSSGASTVSATSTSSSNPTNASNSNDNNQSSGLSSGAKAGIGVGVSVGALAIIGAALAVFFLRRRKGPNASRSIVASNQGYGGYIEGSSELGTEHKSPGQLSAETAYGGPPLATQQQGYYDPVPQHNPLAAGNGWQQEPQQHELAGGHEMHELDGGRRVQS